MSEKTALSTKLMDDLLSIYSEAENEMLRKLAKRVDSKVIDGTWTELKLSEVASYRGEVADILSKTSSLSKMKIDQAVVDAYYSGVRGAEDSFGVPITPMDKANVPLHVKRFVLEQENAIAGTHLQILRSSQDVFRDVIASASEMSVVGVDTARGSAQKALNMFADKGITGFVDKSGRKWELASYVDMATRTTQAHAYVQGHIDRQISLGRDLVIVNGHPNACPLCLPWQGKILSISGTDPRYPSLKDAIAAGLFHPNCRHTLTGYIDGLTRIRTYSQDDAGFKVTQEQRYNERMIRKWKRRQAVAITSVDALQAVNYIKEYQARQRKLLEEYAGKYDMTLRRKYDRESLSFFGKKIDESKLPVPEKVDESFEWKAPSVPKPVPKVDSEADIIVPEVKVFEKPPKQQTIKYVNHLAKESRNEKKWKQTYQDSLEADAKKMNMSVNKYYDKCNEALAELLEKNGEVRTYKSEKTIEAMFKELKQLIDDEIKQNPGISMQDAVEKYASQVRFKTLFETNRSGGSTNTSYRSRCEQDLFGYPQDLDPESRPVYGFLGDSSEFYSSSTQNAASYGGGSNNPVKIIVSFKKDVKNATTLYINDTLNSFKNHLTKGTNLAKPKITMLEKYDYSDSKTLLQKLQSYKQVDSLKANHDLRSDYLEVQIHDKQANFANIDTIYVKGDPSLFKNKNFINLLDMLGIKVKQMP